MICQYFRSLLHLVYLLTAILLSACSITEPNVSIQRATIPSATIQVPEVTITTNENETVVAITMDQQDKNHQETHTDVTSLASTEVVVDTTLDINDKTITLSPEVKSTKVATIEVTSISPESVAIDMEDIFEDPNCLLPCFLNFHPQKTKYDEVLRWIMQRTIYFDTYETSDGDVILGVFLDSPLYTAGTDMRQEYYFINGVLNEALVTLPEHTSFSVRSLFEVYGQPAAIWIEAFQNSEMFRLSIYYPSHGFYVAYEIKGKYSTVDEVIIGCLGHTEYGQLITWDPSVWNPDNNKTILDRSEENRSSLLRLGENAKSIELTTNFSVSNFYEAVLHNGENGYCIETPFEHWPEVHH